MGPLNLTPATLKLLTLGSVWFVSWRKDLPIIIVRGHAEGSSYMSRPRYRYIDELKDYEMTLSIDEKHQITKANEMWQVLYG